MQVTAEDRELYEALTAGFENEGGVKTDNRGGVQLKYITGEQCVTRLNNTFGVLGWKFEIRERWYDQEADELCILGRLTVFRKMALLEPSIGLDGSLTSVAKEVVQEIYHEQVGSQKHNRRRTTLITAEAYDNLKNEPGKPLKEVLFTQQDTGWYRKNDSNYILDTGFDWKGAGTDSLKKCASWFGIALELSKKPAQQARGAPSRPQQGQQQPNGPQRQAPNQRPPQGQQQAPEKPQGPSFKPPFKSQKFTEELACRAQDCGVVMVAGEGYETDIDGKTITQKTEYIVKRSKEEAFGTVLCLAHLLDWIQAKRDQGVTLASNPTKANGSAA